LWTKNAPRVAVIIPAFSLLRLDRFELALFWRTKQRETILFSALDREHDAHR